MGPEDLAVLARDAAEIAPADGLREKLALARPLRVKLGLDPTAPAVTLGWAVVLRKLRQFQDAGHVAVLIVGDYTARVGDPSGKSETRRRLSKDEVDGFAEHLLGQFRKILSEDRLEIRRNSEWLESMGMDEALHLMATTTVAQMLERDDFSQRHAAGKPISLMEFMYPLLQGFDSVAVKADIELGGTDQLFNLLVGRELQRDHGQEPQVALTTPLLEGLDGVQKMSQSLGNYVGIDEPPEVQFERLMSIPDGLIIRYLRLCTSATAEEVAAAERGLSDGSMHPNQAKRAMAGAVVELYHGPGAGQIAEQRFDLVHRDRQVPDDVPEVTLVRSDVVKEANSGVRHVYVPALLVDLGLAATKSEARRALQQKGVRRDGILVEGEEQRLTVDESDLDGSVWQIGRQRFARLRWAT